MANPPIHLCDALGCDQWGSFGFAVGKGRPLVWYCGQHREAGEGRLAPAVPAPDADPVLDRGGQGRLL